ncbi:MAG: hypothetical protein RSE29_12915 [Leclercia sp.]
MNRSVNERLTDELIGEATLSLLQENGPISIKALLDRLRSMMSTERDSVRRDALTQIIAEISSDSIGAPARKTNSDEPAGDQDGLNSSNVFPLFGDSQQSRSSKKH